MLTGRQTDRCTHGNAS